MKIHYYIFVIACLCNIQSLKSQNFSIAYDANGNRTSRFISLKSTNAYSTDQSDPKNSVNRNEVFTDDLGEQKVIIYPNPTSGLLKVEITGFDFVLPSSINVYNESGKLLIQKSPAAVSEVIDLSEFPAGLYIMKLDLNGKKSEWKILKE